LKLKNPEKALAALERLSKAYPDNTWMPEIRYQISKILSQLGRYEASAGSATRWLDRYQEHFLKKDVLLLLGDDFCAMGETEGAFYAWVEAREGWKDDPEKVAALDQKLETLVATSSPTLLSHLLKTNAALFIHPEYIIK
jgi:tetratricopeptide (TPR) repeat protein